MMNAIGIRIATFLASGRNASTAHPKKYGVATVTIGVRINSRIETTTRNRRSGRPFGHR
jgi:hypothetical protein